MTNKFLPSPCLILAVAFALAFIVAAPTSSQAQGFKTFYGGPDDLRLVLDADSESYTDDWYWDDYDSFDGVDWGSAPWLFHLGTPSYPLDQALFYSPSLSALYTIVNLSPVLFDGGDQGVGGDEGDGRGDDGGDWGGSDDDWDWGDEEYDDEEYESGLYLSQEDLDKLLKAEFEKGRRAGLASGRTLGISQGLKVGREEGYTKGLADGRRQVTRNPAKYKLIAAGNVPGGVVVTTKKGNKLTLSLAGKWSRLAASGVPKGWRFDQKRGQLTGVVNRSGKLKLQAYNGKSAAFPLQIELKATSK